MIWFGWKESVVECKQRELDQADFDQIEDGADVVELERVGQRRQAHGRNSRIDGLEAAICADKGSEKAGHDML